MMERTILGQMEVEHQIAKLLVGGKLSVPFAVWKKLTLSLGIQVSG